jgi:hypothetical protein
METKRNYKLYLPSFTKKKFCIGRHYKECNFILIYGQQDATLHSLFYLETAVHISGDTTTHHQKRKQLYLQHLLLVRPLLLPADIAAGSSILSNILIYIKQDATLHNLFYLETALQGGREVTVHPDSMNLRLNLI